MEKIAYNLAEYIKFKTSTDVDIIFSDELINYILCEDSNSETDKYFKNHTSKYDYDLIFFEMIINIPDNINFETYCLINTNRDKIIEYALFLLSRKQI
jgi:hypothetical protein